MQDQPTRRSPAADMDQVEHVVLSLLLNSEPVGLWSVAEVSRALGSEIATEDAIVGLHAAGLVHRCHEFVFPTRPAVRLGELEHVDV
jgi:hypothetical protein